MFTLLRGETLVKLILICSFLICYGLGYQTMVKDERYFEKTAAARLEKMERQLSTY